MTDVRAARWRVGAPATLSLVTLGLLYASPLLLASALVPLGFVAYGALSAVPADATVRVEREMNSPAPAPGDRVTVTVTVTNAGEGALPDCRVVDGVPPELAVVEGSPRGSFALRPGESASYTYTVVARRGEFVFDPAGVRLRSLAASGVRTETVSVEGAERVVCRYPLTDAATGTATLRRTGTHPTDSGGPGTEFHSTREYRPGDPQSRIHWRRLAKTGELTTVSFREERAVRTVLLVDARPPGRVAPRPGVPTGADLCGYAGERLFESLTGAGVVTSVAALGIDGEGVGAPVRAGGFPWVDGTADGTTTLARAVFAAVQEVAGTRTRVDGPPATGPAGDRHAATAATGQETPGTGAETASPGPEVTDATADSEEGGDDPATDGTRAHPDGGSERARLLLSHLPPGAEVVLLTPLLDEWPVELVRTLRGQDHPVTVVSPDVSGTGSLGGDAVGAERRLRLASVAATGATVGDWTPGEPLEFALAESAAHLLGGSR